MISISYLRRMVAVAAVACSSVSQAATYPEAHLTALVLTPATRISLIPNWVRIGPLPRAAEPYQRDLSGPAFEYIGDPFSTKQSDIHPELGLVAEVQ